MGLVAEYQVGDRIGIGRSRLNDDLRSFRASTLLETRASLRLERRFRLVRCGKAHCYEIEAGQS